MEIRTSRLVLREIVADDWQAMLAYQSDPRYLRYYALDRPDRASRQRRRCCIRRGRRRRTPSLDIPSDTRRRQLLDCASLLRGQERSVLDPDGAFAHTSPVYVAVAGAPLALRDDAAYFVEWIERLIATTESRARFPSNVARDAVITVFREGQAYYRALV